MRLIGTTFGTSLAAALTAAALCLALPGPAAAQTDPGSPGGSDWLRNQLNGLLDTGGPRVSAEQRREYGTDRADPALSPDGTGRATAGRRAATGEPLADTDAYGPEAHKPGTYNYSWRDHVGLKVLGGGSDPGAGNADAAANRPYNQPYGGNRGPAAYGGTSAYDYNGTNR